VTVVRRGRGVDAVFSAMRAGARGYVLKGAEQQETARAITAVAAGHNNHQIAERLSLSGKTVANHVSAIFAKLQVADRTQAILRARDAGLGHP
jgi:DNA-binding NarL/FixJ family response regulator